MLAVTPYPTTILGIVKINKTLNVQRCTAMGSNGQEKFRYGESNPELPRMGDFMQ